MSYFFEEEAAIDEAEFLAAKNGVDMAVVDERDGLRVRPLADTNGRVIEIVRGEYDDPETSGVHPAG